MFNARILGKVNDKKSRGGHVETPLTVDSMLDLMMKTEMSPKFSHLSLVFCYLSHLNHGIQDIQETNH